MSRRKQFKKGDTVSIRLSHNTDDKVIEWLNSLTANSINKNIINALNHYCSREDDKEVIKQAVLDGLNEYFSSHDMNNIKKSSNKADVSSDVNLNFIGGLVNKIKKY